MTHVLKAIRGWIAWKGRQEHDRELARQRKAVRHG